MKIENLRSEKKADRARVTATIIWEDCDRPPQEIFFETHETFARDISCNPHAFLVACIMPAMRFREERVFIDAEICPELRGGLNVAMCWMRHWFDNYRADDNLVRIEAKTQHRVPSHPRPARAGFFFSGGVDSLATLRANRLNYPLEHPGSIKDALLVYGLEVREPDKFEHVFRSVSELAEDARVTLIPVYTNIRDLGPESDRNFWQDFWIKEFMGAAFAAIAHVFSKRLSSVYIASTDDIPGLSLLKRQNLKPFSTHPLIDPNYSSTDLRIHHDGIAISRLNRTKLVAEWGMALRHLRVCNRFQVYQPDMLNCGICEKCVRTMLELLVVNALDKTPAFLKDDVSEEQLATIKIMKPITKKSYANEHNYLELIDPLRKRGRNDLVRAIERKIAEHNEPEWKKSFKRNLHLFYKFDQKYLAGNITKAKKFFYSSQTR